MRSETLHQEKIDKLNKTVAQQQEEIKFCRTQMRELFDQNDEKIVSMTYNESMKKSVPVSHLSPEYIDSNGV